MAQAFMQVDWSKIPPPEDHGEAEHLPGMRLPHVSLQSTGGGAVDVGGLDGISVLYFYPRTGRPDEPLPEGWDDIPGARGCTPQSCGFRDHFAELRGAGATHVFGISTQEPDYQREAAERLHLPFALLSDAGLLLATALRLPILDVAGMRLVKRITLIAHDGLITKIFYPVFPPDRNAGDVLAALQAG